MIKEDVWKELSLIERALYYEFKAKFTVFKDGTDNANNISMPKSEYTQFMNERTFIKSVDNLIEHGFIRVVENRWNTRECTIYGFSKQWRYYGTDKFNVTDSDRRNKRVLGETHKENIIKALVKTNSKKSKDEQIWYIYIGDVKIHPVTFYQK